jgi:hypothetical protein
MSDRISYHIIYRLLARALEVATEPDVPMGVKHVYEGLLSPCATAFCQGHEAVAECEEAVKRARRSVREGLAELDGLFREARLLVLAFLPEKTLPDTLKAQPTDTDTLNAVTAVSAALQANATEPWAAAVLQGPYGTLAPKVIDALKESIAAAKTLAAARQQRSSARKPAYAQFLVFKRMVRETMGSSSVQYRRLHVRAKVARQLEQTEQEAPESGVIPSTQGGSAAQTGSSTSVKVA